MSDNPPPNFAAAPPVIPTSITDQFNLFDKAAKKDIHWWFFALLMIGMAYVGFERWEFGKERELLQIQISRIQESQLAYVTTKSETMMSALLNNTRALEANTQTLNRIEFRKGVSN